MGVENKAGINSSISSVTETHERDFSIDARWFVEAVEVGGTIFLPRRRNN